MYTSDSRDMTISMYKCKQQMIIWIYLLVHGIVRVSIVSKRRTLYLIINQAIRKNVMSCRHEFEVAGIFAMAILNFFFSFLFLNYALIFVINHEAGNIAKS